jgi:hypothetical protein
MRDEAVLTLLPQVDLLIHQGISHVFYLESTCAYLGEDQLELVVGLGEGAAKTLADVVEQLRIYSQ